MLNSNTSFQVHFHKHEFNRHIHKQKYAPQVHRANLKQSYIGKILSLFNLLAEKQHATENKRMKHRES